VAARHRVTPGLFAFLGGVLRGIVAGLMPVGDEVQFAVVGQVVGDEPAGGRVELDPVGPQLSSVVRDTREISDTAMMPMMNSPEVASPSGLRMMFSTRAYNNTAVNNATRR
jgi:hypothetical protein